jgi:hypothetical protein
MLAKPAAKPGVQRLHEWEAFLALSQVMDLGTLDVGVYCRLQSACGRVARETVVTREALILESGLSFFDECAEPDLALMSLVRQGILEPVASQPFRFKIHLPAALAPENGESANYSSEESFMQQATFTAETPTRSPVLLPAGSTPDIDNTSATQDTAVAELPLELAERLKQPLAREAISAHPNKPGLSTVKAIYVIERLNEVFGLNGWEDDYEVVETGPMIVVRGCLRIPKYGIVRQQYGGNDNEDRGDAYKGACTDALSKCASQLGIAIDVYKGRGPGCLPSTKRSDPKPSSGISNGDRIDLRPESDDDRGRRFREIERVLGRNVYLSVFSRHGYADQPEALEIQTARAVYADLLRILRRRFELLRQQVDKSSYRRLLTSLRLGTNAKLNAEQLIRVFERLWEVIDAQS